MNKKENSKSKNTKTVSPRKKDLKNKKKDRIFERITPWFKKFKLSEQRFNILEVILIMIITIFFGVLIGSNINYQEKEIVKVQTSEFDKVFNKLLDEYYNKINSNELLEAAISGMLNYLNDDNTTYIDSESLKEFEERIEGVYYGIGAALSYSNNNQTIVSTVFNNTPASKAGLKVGDIISKVNGTNVLGKAPAIISDMIKGKNNKNIKLIVLRNGKELELKLITASIDIPSVESKTILKDNKKIGYINISIFASNTTKQFKEALDQLKSKNIDSLIIDVRDNIGGHLNVVTDILELLLPKNTLLYQIKSKELVQKIYDETKESADYQMVVLTNGTSASASEILASALKENEKATIVGEKTYGKGTVQTTMNLSTGGMIKYTIQTWLTPKGNEINKVGVTPTIEIKLSDEYYANPSDSTDNQLQKGIEVLK